MPGAVIHRKQAPLGVTIPPEQYFISHRESELIDPRKCRARCRLLDLFANDTRSGTSFYALSWPLSKKHRYLSNIATSHTSHRQCRAD